MAEIRFGDYSQDFERFFGFAHLIVCGVSVLLALLSIFGADHFRYLPVIFFLAGLLAFLDAYDSFRVSKRVRKRAGAGAAYLILGLAMWGMTYVTALCFWVV